MAGEIVLLDSSILIEYYRKKDKSKTVLFQLAKTYTSFAIFAVSHFEIYAGASQDQLEFWDLFFAQISILPFSAEVSAEAVKIDAALKKKRKQIAIPDLFIAATALFHSLPVATLNNKHFDRVDNIEVLPK
jgi:tRNA(fMet)-specific endonuclease VapC